MNDEGKLIALVTLAGGLTLSVVDIRAFYVARKADKTAKFDWGIAFSSFMIGAIGGFTSAVGYGAVIG